MSQSDQLGIPDVARADAKSFEVLRVWIAKDDQHVSLRVRVWSDPAAWGILLADLAKHVAMSYEQDMGFEATGVLARIKAALDAEFSLSTDSPTGGTRPDFM